MKNKIIPLISLLGFIIFAVIIGVIIRATSISVERYDAVVTIDSSGNMEVSETWVIDYPDGYNVRFRDIIYNKDHQNNPLTKGLDTNKDITYFDSSAVSVSVIDLDENVDVENIRVGYSFKGDKDELGDYIECEPYSSTCESIFVDLTAYGGMKGKKAFTYTYRINGAVTQYSDISELNWVLFNYAESTVKEATIEIHLPSNRYTKDEIYAWGHGVTTGDINIQDGQNISMTAWDIGAEEELEFRIAFPNDVVSNISSNNIVSGNLKEDIIEYETELANLANKQRIVVLVFNVATALLVIYTVFIIIKAYKNFDKEYEPNFKEEYLREPPSDITPAEMSYLYYFGKTQDEDVTATLLNLVHKKVLKLNDHGVGITDDNPDFDIILNDGVNLESLTQHEKIVIEMFINLIGDGKKVSTVEIKNYGKKNYSNANKLMAIGERFVKCVKNEFKSKNYFENAKQKALSKGGAYILVHMIFILVLLVVGAMYSVTALLNIVIAIVLAVAYYIYLLLIKKRTKLGNEEYTKWKAFKNFLENFSDFTDYPMPGIVIWEKYLVYATSLKIADKVMKQLKVTLPDVASDDVGDVTFMRGYYYGNRYNNFYIYNSLSTSYGSARMNAMSTIAAHQASSGGGRGGGFSGGRSFGGGGGGGRSR